MIKVRAGRIYASIPFPEKHKCKMIAGYQWEKGPIWSWPLKVKTRVCCIFPELQEAIDIETEKYRLAVRNMQEVKANDFQNLQITKAMFPKRDPLNHQITMIKNMVVDRKHALFCEVGTCKSQAVVNTFDYLKKQGLVNRCLIVCLKTAADNWINEIEINSDYTSQNIYGLPKKRMEQINKDKDFYVINYDGLKVLKKYDGWDKFDMVVLDESVEIKNPEAVKTIFIHETFRRTKYKYILDGTPITQAPIDLWTQFHFLNPGYFKGMNYYEFRNHYCVKGGYKDKETIGYKNMEELKAIVKLHSTQFKKEECFDLPEKLYVQHKLEMSEELKQQYKEMSEDYLMYSEKGILSAGLKISQGLRLRQILSGIYLTNQNENPKLVELRRIIEGAVGNGRQVVVWCEFIESIKLVKNMVEGMGISCSQLYGKIENRTEQIQDFEEHRSKVIVIQIRMGKSINLIAGTINYYFSNTFSFRERNQSEGRTHRKGQTKKVLYIDPVYKDTVEEHMMEVIRDKQDIAAYLVKSFKKGIYEEGEAA